ncbi:MAG TPA: glycosyltransferase [Kineosporiaceae bacterium]|nr:glycosyltransferase [Kineosporiaceae bacterium]
MTAGTSQLVLAMVGTDHHPFDRLVDWMDEWAQDQPHGAVRVVVQHGRTHAPRAAESRDFIPRRELDALIAEASVVVCHGGPSTIVETRRRGLSPIVLARSTRLGEHVDDHQQRFARAMSDRGLIRLVTGQADLTQAVDEALVNPLLVDKSVVDDPGQSALRLGRLVEELIARPSTPRWSLRRDRQPTG